jgi:hypothetical protein
MISDKFIGPVGPVLVNFYSTKQYFSCTMPSGPVLLSNPVTDRQTDNNTQYLSKLQWAKPVTQFGWQKASNEQQQTEPIRMSRPCYTCRLTKNRRSWEVYYCFETSSSYYKSEDISKWNAWQYIKELNAIQNTGEAISFGNTMKPQNKNPFNKIFFWIKNKILSPPIYT